MSKDTLTKRLDDYLKGLGTLTLRKGDRITRKVLVDGLVQVTKKWWKDYKTVVK